MIIPSQSIDRNPVITVPALIWAVSGAHEWVRSSAVPSNPKTDRPYLSPHLRGTSGPDQTYSKRVAFHEGGFLQVAVSEAPRSGHATAHRRVWGAPDSALGLNVTDRNLGERVGNLERIQEGTVCDIGLIGI